MDAAYAARHFVSTLNRTTRNPASNTATYPSENPFRARLSSFLAASPLLIALVLTLLVANPSSAQAAQLFRLDGGDSTYAFGVNERGELQTLYWGGRIGPQDSVPPAHSLPEWSSFDSPATTTPQEYAGWGTGLFTEPALKVSFADGNRDLVLHFVKATT